MTIAVRCEMKVALGAGILACLAVLPQPSCSHGPAPGPFVPVEIPPNVTYRDSSSVYYMGMTIRDLIPTIDPGTTKGIVSASSYAVSPGLPAGLVLNPQTGVISGTLSVRTPVPTTAYVVRALLNTGTWASASLVFAVLNEPAVQMTVPRTGHSALLLPSGKVLLAGGVPLWGTRDNLEWFDPTTGTFSLMGSSQEVFPQSATLLSDGRILFCIGSRLTGPDYTARLLDPETGSFTVTGSMSMGEAPFSATILKDGNVFLVGTKPPTTATGQYTFCCEIYDRTTGLFTPTKTLGIPRRNHTSTLLPDGKVLLAGGAATLAGASEPQATAEVYDPATDRFTAIGNLSMARMNHTATSLADGKILLLGGTGSGGSDLVSAEVYDPSTGQFSSVGNLSTRRAGHATSLLPSGVVLVVGGGYTGTATAELFDPLSRTFTQTGSCFDARGSGVAATLMPGGKVLVTGGSGIGPGLNSAEWYDPASGTFRLNGQ